jgi:flavin reductase (DIM6/NTAB) family NADH-FMN oxidoreductase RutF
MQKQVEFGEAVKLKFPEGVVYAVARDAAGKANPITLGWSMQVSQRPPMWAMALRPERYTTECIRQRKCFTFVMPTVEMGDDAMFFGTKSGRDLDKFAARNTILLPGASIDSVLVADAVANFECVLDGELLAGDHIIFTGRVVASHVNTSTCRRLYTIETGRIFGAFAAEKRQV